jgi:hypothetical protein
MRRADWRASLAMLEMARVEPRDWEIQLATVSLSIFFWINGVIS